MTYFSSLVKLSFSEDWEKHPLSIGNGSENGERVDEMGDIWGWVTCEGKISDV